MLYALNNLYKTVGRPACLCKCRGLIHQTRFGADKSAPYKTQQTFYTFLIDRLVDFKVLNFELCFSLFVLNFSFNSYKHFVNLKLYAKRCTLYARLFTND